MRLNDIDLATTQELVDELLRRNTFQGLILHLDNHLLRPEQVAVYRIERARLTEDEAMNVLQVCADTIDQSTWGQDNYSPLA